jgi:hypothetical protein
MTSRAHQRYAETNTPEQSQVLGSAFRPEDVLPVEGPWAWQIAAARVRRRSSSARALPQACVVRAAAQCHDAKPKRHERAAMPMQGSATATLATVAGSSSLMSNN